MQVQTLNHPRRLIIHHPCTHAALLHSEFFLIGLLVVARDWSKYVKLAPKAAGESGKATAGGV